MKTSNPEKLLTEIAKEVPKLMEAYHVPGLSLALAGNDGTILNQSFGVQSSITGEPVRQNTVFEAASLSKPVFAYVVLKLCETEQLDLDKHEYEFQMLLGVDEQLRSILVNSGHRLRVYVPYGQQWYAYVMRRLKENPKIAVYVLKALFKK